jgi:phosphoribosylanthranilate isomerase
MSTLVKICGITNLADAEVAVDAGAEFLGFNFYAKSPRHVTPETVRQILTALAADAHTAGRPAMVGIFVNTPVDQVQAVLDSTGLDYAQLHGDETPQDVAALGGRGFKALRPSSLAAARDQAAAFTVYPHAAAPQLLVDAYSTQAYGGTGHRADWEIAAALAQIYPRLMLAGGLDPENVAAALAAVRPWGVDVGSGVEVAPGRKDHAKLRAFVAAVRQVSG